MMIFTFGQSCYDFYTPSPPSFVEIPLPLIYLIFMFLLGILFEHLKRFMVSLKNFPLLCNSLCHLFYIKFVFHMVFYFRGLGLCRQDTLSNLSG